MDTSAPLQSNNLSADCAQFSAQFEAYLEHDLQGEERTWMDQHLVGCASCAQLQREMDALVQAARSLPDRAPERDLWSGIEARLEATVIPISGSTSPATATRPARTVSIRSFAVAAALLVAVTSGVTWRLANRSARVSTMAQNTDTTSSETTVDITGGSSSAPTTLPTRLPARVSTVSQTDESDADVVYEQEISGLRRMVDDRLGELDSVTVRELRRNLEIIDRAILDSKRALARYPRSAVLATQLDHALETKLALMRRVALL